MTARNRHRYFRSPDHNRPHNPTADQNRDTQRLSAAGRPAWPPVSRPVGLEVSDRDNYQHPASR